VIALRALADGFRAVARSWGLAVVMLGTNLLMAAALAVPLAGEIERSLAKTDSSRRMLYGFDYSWWSHFADTRSGWVASFGPDILGAGFAFKNLDLLLKGALPLGAFSVPEDADDGEQALIDPIILAAGAGYLVLQVFLMGGVLTVLRGARGEWTARSLLHGAGFYFGRFLRITLLGLLLHGIVFALGGPLARWGDHQAREAVSETTATAWLLGRHAVLLAGLLLVSLVTSYARVITVLEERASAVLAVLSGASFCLRHLLRTAGQYAAVIVLGLLLLAAWRGVDGRWRTTGYKTQLVTLVLAEAMLLGRMALRLALAGGQISLYRRLTAASATPPS
jgi:hypothetical protein